MSWGSGFGATGGSGGVRVVETERVVEVERIVEVEVEKIVEKIVEVEVPAPTEFMGPWVHATGGEVTDYTDRRGVAWREHKFADTGLFSVSAPGEVEVTAIGGGGGGGDASYYTHLSGGGGGAGGFVCATTRAEATDYPVSVGAGAPYGYYVDGVNWMVGPHPAGTPSRALGLEALGGESGFGDWSPVADSPDIFFPISSTSGSASDGYVEPGLRGATIGQGHAGSRHDGYYGVSGGGGGAGGAGGALRHSIRVSDTYGASSESIVGAPYPFPDEPRQEEDTENWSYTTWMRLRHDGGVGVEFMTAAGAVAVCGGGAGDYAPDNYGEAHPPLASHGGGLPDQHGATNTGGGGGGGVGSGSHGGSGVVYIRYRRQV